MKKIAYKPAPGSHMSLAKAQRYGPVLERMQKENRLRKKEVVNEARPSESPLHDGFEWDDGVAAEKHREEQASLLIRSVRVVVIDTATSEEISVRAFVAVGPPDRKVERNYLSLGRAISDEEAWETVLHDIQTWLSSAQRKLTQFGKVEEANQIGLVLKSLKKKK